MTTEPASRKSPEAEWGSPRSKEVVWYDSAVLVAAGAELSGRDVLDSVASGALPPPPMASLVGAQLVAVGDGEVVFRCTPDEATYNPVGIVHGGLLCTLLDFAAGAAVQTLLPAGTDFSSIEIKASYLKPLRADSGTIEVHGRVLQLGGRVAFAEADARDEDGELVGHATSSLAVLRPTSARPPRTPA